MKPGVKYGLIFSAIWVIYKIVLFQLDLGQHELIYGVFGNLLLILLAIFFTVYEVTQKREKESPMGFLSDVKNGMQSVGVYSLVVIGFVLVQYTIIEPDYLENRVNAIMAEAEKQDYEEEQRKNSMLKDVSRQEYLEKARKDHEAINSLKVIVPFYLIGMMFIGMLYSFIVTLLNRRVWSHFQ
jgi:hypothetical protein